MKKIFVILVIFSFSIPSVLGTSSFFNNKLNSISDLNQFDDYDPFVDIIVTVEIKTIRLLEKEDTSDIILMNKPFFREILFDYNPSFYVKISINEEEFTSNIWNNQKYIYDPNWNATLNVPDEEELVNIKIELLDSNNNVFCDISPDEGETEEGRNVEIIYDIKTGHWILDDEHEDNSGYGRLSGTDDGTIYENDFDCEIWFDIYQNDYDGDRIPYWSEVNLLGTDPNIDDTFLDPDNDDIPTYWEWKWNYDPLSWNDHKNLDPDEDSINNYEEFLTSEWFSDPNRKDVFVEMDKMDDGPNGEITYFPLGAKELIITAFDRQNIAFHLDMGEMGGYDLIPFDSNIGRGDLNNLYVNYFLHNDENNWRRGVFHYGLVVYNENPPGYIFRSNAFQIASVGMEDKLKYFFLERDIVYGSAYMHELGHTFAFYPIPGHDFFSKYPWQLGFWKNRPYKSCMNYGWMYKFVDYSDGSRGNPDMDDWERINYYAFEDEWG